MYLIISMTNNKKAYENKLFKLNSSLISQKEKCHTESQKESSLSIKKKEKQIRKLLSFQNENVKDYKHYRKPENLIKLIPSNEKAKLKRFLLKNLYFQFNFATKE